MLRVGLAITYFSVPTQRREVAINGRRQHSCFGNIPANKAIGEAREGRSGLATKSQ